MGVNSYCELLGTSCDIPDLLYVICIYHETASETPVGNVHSCELNIALLYSWVYLYDAKMDTEGMLEDTNISAAHSLK